MSTNIRVGGYWLSRESRFGDLEATWEAHGAADASWSMALKAGERPAFMKRGAVVEVYDGPLLIWSGTLAEPDWENGNFAAVGIARQGESAQCLNGAGAVTSKPNTAIDQAIARGVVRWTRADSFGTTDLAGPEGASGVNDPDPGSLTDLLDLWAAENSKQWRVTDDGRLVQATDTEATSTWLVLPEQAEFGVADDRLLDRVFLRYSDSAAGVYRTTSFPASTPGGGIERRASVVARGPMTAARAASIAQGIYNAAQAGRTGWTNSVDLVAEQIITRGGQRPRISAIRPGHTLTLLGATDPRNGLGSTSVVIDRVTWRPAEGRVQISPVGKVADTFEEILTTYQAEGA